MKRAAAFIASFLLAALPFGASAADARADAGSAPETAKGKSIVVYFSASGNTKAAAEKIAELTGSDLMEIVPEEKYTEADLNWHDGESRSLAEKDDDLKSVNCIRSNCIGGVSRSSVERDDDSIRPAIKPDTKNFADYDTVFLGYPIWWGTAPKVVWNFVEKHDFTGKTVLPFCTSHSSPEGESGRTLERLSGNKGTWKVARRFVEHPSDSDISSWLNEAGFALKK